MVKTEAASDRFQDAWEDPEKFYALYVDDENGCMVIPDAMPVVKHHVLIIAREQIPYQELPQSRQLQMMALANVTDRHMDKVLSPKRRIGYAIWGNAIKTAHIHLLPRNAPEDGHAFFDGMRKKATEKQLAATYTLLRFPKELQKTARQLLDF